MNMLISRETLGSTVLGINFRSFWLKLLFKIYKMYTHTPTHTHTHTYI